MLRFTYELSHDLSSDAPIRIQEGRGWVHYELHNGVFLPEGAAALTSASQALLAGGQWFQLWRGDVISMETPEGRNGWIYRGSMAH
ncbi:MULTISPECIES: hypothetical protein [unclassified Streptomyces]|uniref:hypothetical protein n=1 Tax=unclassified Streptomyces TaxID=2593676 RepID=UPI00131A902D|nr:MULTISPECIES: hypothetical protein [unclassified Streptomyces]